MHFRKVGEAGSGRSSGGDGGDGGGGESGVISDVKKFFARNLLNASTSPREFNIYEYFLLNE